jgi:Protein of unknown function (DUF4242)
MTKFLVERRFHVGEDEMQEVGRRSRQIIEENFPEITWHHTHVVVGEDSKVRTYCIYEAPNEEVVRSHSELLGLHDIAYLAEIAGDVTPNDFPL